MTEAYLIDAVRTPVGRRGGGLSEVRPADLGAHVIKGLIDRTGLDPEQLTTSYGAAVTPSDLRPATSLAPAGWRPDFQKKSPGSLSTGSAVRPNRLCTSPRKL